MEQTKAQIMAEQKQISSVEATILQARIRVKSERMSLAHANADFMAVKKSTVQDQMALQSLKQAHAELTAQVEAEDRRLGQLVSVRDSVSREIAVHNRGLLSTEERVITVTADLKRWAKEVKDLHKEEHKLDESMSNDRRKLQRLKLELQRAQAEEAQEHTYDLESQAISRAKATARTEQMQRARRLKEAQALRKVDPEALAKQMERTRENLYDFGGLGFDDDELDLTQIPEPARTSYQMMEDVLHTDGIVEARSEVVRSINALVGLGDQVPDWGALDVAVPRGRLDPESRPRFTESGANSDTDHSSDMGFGDGSETESEGSVVDAPSPARTSPARTSPTAAPAVSPSVSPPRRQVGFAEPPPPAAEISVSDRFMNLKKMWGLHGDFDRVGTVRKLKSKLDEELTLAHEIDLANRAAVN